MLSKLKDKAKNTSWKILSGVKGGSTKKAKGQEDKKKDEAEEEPAKEEVAKKDEDSKEEEPALEVEVSTVGVNVAWLIDFASKCDEDWTTTDVCMKMVMPQTKNKDPDATSKGKAYADLDPDLKFKDKLVFGKAEYFCSHAWRYKFRNCIDAVRMFCELNKRDPSETYIWFDMFVNNQHDAPNLPHEWWTSRFKDAIAAFGKTILVLEPWTDPIPITRAWCLWEIYCTIDTKSEFHVTMCQGEHEDFKKKLVKEFDNIRTNISKIDARRAEAWNLHDRDMIFLAIEKTVGFSKLNDSVMGKMREWLTSTGEAHLKEVEEEHGAEHRETLETCDMLGKLYRDNQRWEEAIKLFKRAADGFEKTTGVSQHTCQCLNDLAFAYQNDGKLDEAIEIHEKCLAARTELLGELHKDTTQSMSNMATALRLLGKLAKSKTMFSKAVNLRDKIDTLGPNHPATLYTVSMYASCLTEAGDNEEAMSQHRRALDGLQKFFSKIMPDGRKHPLTLLAIHNLGEHLFKIAKNNEAMDFLLEAYQGRIEKLGAANELTLQTRTLLEEVTEAMKAAGGRVRITNFEASNVEAFRKSREGRKALWKKAADYLAFKAALRQSSGYSEKDFAH